MAATTNRSPRPKFDRANLNQLHADAGTYTEYCVVYTGYGDYQGMRLRVIIETSDPDWADGNLSYVRGRQREHGGPVDARLESRTVTAGPWIDSTTQAPSSAVIDLRGRDLQSAPGYVSCSNCAQQFIIPGRTDGFSHCDLHEQWTPVPEDQQQWIRPS
jgi:hypothetical protein